MSTVVLADHTKPIEEERVKLSLVREATGAETVEARNGDQEDLTRAISNADVVFVHRARIDVELLDKAPRLGLIIKCGIGVDTIDVAAATERGIYVANNPERGPDVAEHTMGLLLSLTRRVALADRHARMRAFPSTYDFTYLGSRLAGKTLGLVGFGKIARDLVPMARGMGLRVIAHSRTLTAETAASHGAERAESLDSLIEEADIVSLHVPSSNETTALISADVIAKMKNSAIILNTARGDVVDETALLAALKEKRLAGYAADVAENEPLRPEEPLLSLDNVILTPHMGWSSDEALRDGETVPARQCIQYLRSEPVDHILNDPTNPRSQTVKAKARA